MTTELLIYLLLVAACLVVLWYFWPARTLQRYIERKYYESYLKLEREYIGGGLDKFRNQSKIRHFTLEDEHDEF